MAFTDLKKLPEKLSDWAFLVSTISRGVDYDLGVRQQHKQRNAEMTSKLKTFWVADSVTDVENGWTVESNNRIGTPEFWADCDKQHPQFDDDGAWFCIVKAVELDDDRNWVTDVIGR